MEKQGLRVCGNCGYVWDPETTSDLTIGLVCPVCEYSTSGEEASWDLPEPTSERELVELLSAFLDHARHGGIDNETIMRVLRDELEFTAELVNHGRRFCVQVLDLGPQEAGAPYGAQRDRSVGLRSRGLHA